MWVISLSQVLELETDFVVCLLLKEAKGGKRDPCFRQIYENKFFLATQIVWLWA